MINLISGIDYLLLIIYSVVIFYCLKRFFFRDLNPVLSKIFAIFFFLKILAVLTYTLLVVYYWQLADSVSVFSETKNLTGLIQADISNIKYLFLPVENYNALVNLDMSLKSIPGGSGIESNYFLTRVCTILYPVSLGKYLLLNFWFGVISTIAQFKLYLVLLKVYPQIKDKLAICILFIPTLLFYASPIYKETLCLSFLCFIIELIYNIRNDKKNLFSFILVLVNLFFIFLLKSYIFYALMISCAFVFIGRFLRRLFSASLFGKFFVFMFLAAVAYLISQNLDIFDSYIYSLIDISNLNQQFYGPTSDTSSFEFGEIETSFAGLLTKMPLGLYTCYFRPHLWEINKPILLLSAVESFLCFWTLFYALVKKGRNFTAVLRKNLLTNIMFLFVLILGIIIGITTFNFGTLVRYKAPAVPFLWIFIFLLLSSSNPKESTFKEEALAD